MVSWDTEGTRAKHDAEELSESAEGEAEKRRGGGGGRAGTTCAGARALLTDGDEDGDGGTTPKKSDCDSWMICGVEGTLRVMALLAGEGVGVGERGVLLGAFILLNKKLGSFSHFHQPKSVRILRFSGVSVTFRVSVSWTLVRWNKFDSST